MLRDNILSEISPFRSASVEMTFVGEIQKKKVPWEGTFFQINHLKLNPMKNQSFTLSCFVFFLLLAHRP